MASHAEDLGNDQPLAAAREPLAAARELQPQSGLPWQGSPWELHLGPVTLRSGGGSSFELRPQMKFGGQVGHIQAVGGFSDVRDGLKFDMGCKASADARSSGRSLPELHENMRQEIGQNVTKASSGAASAIQSTMQWFGLNSTSCSERLGASGSQRVEALWSGASDALENAQRMLSTSASEAGSRLGSIAQSLGLDAADLDAVLSGAGGAAEAKATEQDGAVGRREFAAAYGNAAAGMEDAQASGGAENGEPMSLRVVASAGVSVGAKMCLGWCDTSGYRMVGAGGNASAIISVGGEVFAGWHDSGVGMRLVLGIGHFTFEYDFPRAVRPERFGPRGSGSGAQSSCGGTGAA